MKCVSDTEIEKKWRYKRSSCKSMFEMWPGPHLLILKTKQK